MLSSSTARSIMNLAIYLSTNHFRYFLEGRRFAIYTDHLPLTTAIASAADRSPRQARHQSYVAEFTTDLRHLPRKSNVVADALSRSCAELNAVLASPIDFRDMAMDQQTDPNSIYYKDKVDTGMVLPSEASNYCVIQHGDASDLSFQHHGVRRCLTLSSIWVRSPLSRQSPVNLFGPACTGISPAGASCAVRARLANILARPCKPSWSQTTVSTISMWTL